MAELLESLSNKTYLQQIKALEKMSSEGDDIGFINIDGLEYFHKNFQALICPELYTENAKLKSEDGF